MKLNLLKKIIKYRSTYSGTKETDILYKKYFINNLDKFNINELKLLKSIFDIYSDDEIYDILTNKIIVNSNEFKQSIKRYFNVNSICIYNPLNKSKLLKLSAKKKILVFLIKKNI